MEYIDASGAEWQTMWQDVAQHPLNQGDPHCANHGTRWEYMGSSLDCHYFQHRDHPTTGRHEYLYLERIRAVIEWAS